MALPLSRRLRSSRVICLIFFSEHPPAFSCYRTSEHTSPGVITYDACHVTTDGMDISRGVFTVQTPGIYHLSFTGLFHAENGHGITADIVKESRGGVKTHLGRSTTDVDENGFLGKSL